MAQYLLDITIIWTVLWLIYFLFLRKDTFFKSNRTYLIGATLLGLILPLIRYLAIDSPLGPESEYVLSPISSAIYLSSSTINHSPSQSGFTVTKVLFLVYLLGFGIYLAKLLKGFLEIRQLYINGKKKIIGHCIVVYTDSNHMPFSFYRWIFWSQHFSSNQLDEAKILAHENVHINHWHTLDVVWLEILGIFFWWHPMVYLYKKAIRENHEYICDHFAARDHLNYQVLLQSSRSHSSIELALSNQFFNSHIKSRISMLKKDRSSKWLLAKRLAIIPILLSIISILAFRTDSTDNAPILKVCVPENSSLDQQRTCTKKVLLQKIYAAIIYPTKARQELISGAAVLGLTFDREGLISHDILQDVDHQFQEAFVTVIESLQNLEFELADNEMISFSIPVEFIWEGTKNHKHTVFQNWSTYPSLLPDGHLTVTGMAILKSKGQEQKKTQEQKSSGEKQEVIKKAESLNDESYFIVADESTSIRPSTAFKVNQDQKKDPAVDLAILESEITEPEKIPVQKSLGERPKVINEVVALNDESYSIATNKVIVQVGTTILEEGQDYSIDPITGKVQIINEEYINSNEPISISYKKEPLPILSLPPMLSKLGSALKLRSNSSSDDDEYWVYVYDASGELLHSKISSLDDLQSYNADGITELNVLKGASAIAKYGIKSRQKIVEIYLKNGSSVQLSHDSSDDITPKKNNDIESSELPEPMIVLVDLEGSLVDILSDVNGILPESISSIQVLKGKKAIEKYGIDASNGVIEILLKSEIENKVGRQKLCKNLTLFPNPTSDHITFAIEGPDEEIKLNYYITGVSGKVIGNRNRWKIKGKESHQLDVSTLAKGLYFLIVEEARFKHQRAFQIN